MTMMTNMTRSVYPKPAPDAEWSVAEAKARFSELVAKAKAGVPQRVTRYGKDEVVVVSVEDWKAMTRNAAVSAAMLPIMAIATFEPNLYEAGEVIE